MKNVLPLKKSKHYTYADYLTWDKDTHYQLIDGVPYAMAGASTSHQSISMALSIQIGAFLKGKTCRIYAAPYDVRLNADDNDDTVVMPDLLVICDKSKIQKNSCIGAPDMIIEILSPSTAKLDRIIKLNRYMRAGVREYWIVDPDNKSVQVFLLKDGKYFVSAYDYDKTEIIPVRILDGCEINLYDVFENIE